MNRIIFVVLAVLLVSSTILLAAFFGHSPQQKATFHLKPNENTVLFAVTPWGDPRQMKDAYTPLLNYLAEKTGKKFQLLIMEDYNVAIENIVDRNIDVMVISPVSYVMAKTLDPNLQYIATTQSEHNGQKSNSFEGYLITNKNRFKNWSLEKFIQHANEINLGFVTKASASGWSYPMAMFKKRGIAPSKIFKSVTVYDIHPQATNAVANGKVDLATTWEYNLEQAVAKHGNIFDIVWRSQQIPGLCWVASSTTKPELVQKIRTILTELNSSPRLKELTQSTPDKGWTILDDAAYDEVRSVMKYVEDSN